MVTQSSFCSEGKRDFLQKPDLLQGRLLWHYFLHNILKILTQKYQAIKAPFPKHAYICKCTAQIKDNSEVSRIFYAFVFTLYYIASQQWLHPDKTGQQCMLVVVREGWEMWFHSTTKIWEQFSHSKITKGRVVLLLPAAEQYPGWTTVSVKTITEKQAFYNLKNYFQYRSEGSSHFSGNS